MREWAIHEFSDASRFGAGGLVSSDIGLIEAPWADCRCRREVEASARGITHRASRVVTGPSAGSARMQG